MYKDNVWCLNCGCSLYIKDGLTKDGRQKLQCKICRTKTTINAMKQGESMLNRNKLLPFLNKDNNELTKGELYSLGFLLADGSVSINGTLQLNILEKDVEVANIIKRELEIPNEVKYYTRGDTGQKVIRLSWQNKYAYPFFVAKGLEANKTGNKTWLSFMSNNHFLRGFFDGDGCLFINKIRHKYELSFTGGSYYFLESLNNDLKKTCGHCASKVATQRNKIGDTYRITLYKTALLRVCSYLYEDSDNLRLECKYKKYLEILNK